MKIQRNNELYVRDALRYGCAHIVNGLILILSLGKYRSNAVPQCSLKIARRRMYIK